MAISKSIQKEQEQAYKTIVFCLAVVVLGLMIAIITIIPSVANNQCKTAIKAVSDGVPSEAAYRCKYE